MDVLPLPLNLRFREPEFTRSDDGADERKLRRPASSSSLSSSSSSSAPWLGFEAGRRKLLPGLRNEADDDEVEVVLEEDPWWLKLALARMIDDFSGRYVWKGSGFVKPPVGGGGQEEERMSAPTLTRGREEVEEKAEMLS